MDKLEPLQSFSFEENISQGWKIWLKHFEFYLSATEKDRKTNFKIIFNPNLQTHLKINTSSEELGALLEQNYGTLTYPKWYPIGYA